MGDPAGGGGRSRCGRRRRIYLAGDFQGHSASELGRAGPILRDRGRKNSTSCGSDQRCIFIHSSRQYWADAAPELLESGRVKLQGNLSCFFSSITMTQSQIAVHNFFMPQPPTNAAVFLLRWIMHDWNDASAVHILRHLREAATPATRLLTVEIILPYTCHNVDAAIADLVPAPAPAPLLPNLGAASNMKYWLDFQVCLTNRNLSCGC